MKACVPGWAALNAQSDDAVNYIGGIAVHYLVELPGLGKSGGTIERPKLTRVLPFGARQSRGHRSALLVSTAPDESGRDSLLRPFPDGSGIELAHFP
eukprot:6189786-Pleurochrysis_carterae.AAC.6